jgi:hypothetical protein
MPAWMRSIANVNPVSHAIDALRGAVLGTTTLGDTMTALFAAAVMWLVVVAVPSKQR